MTPLPEFTAEYYNGGKRHGPILQIVHNEPWGRSITQTIEVQGKREARKLATEHGAKPWNF